MSEENVETVRRLLEGIERFFAAFWRSPASIEQALKEETTLSPETREMFSMIHPEGEWQTVFLGRSVRGHLDMARTGTTS